jgi:AcrR family transcriptional regulator
LNKKPGGAHISGSKYRRKKPQQERARVTVAAILEAAGQLLVQKGFAGSSTNAIAKRAGVSIGSLYQYFPNKESIFLALLEGHRDEMWPIRTNAVADLAAGLPVGEVLEKVMLESLAVRNRDPELMAAMHRELAGLEAKHRQEDGSGHGQGEEVLGLVIKARQDLCDEKTSERAWLMITILEAVGRRMVHESLPDLDRETLVSQTVKACQGLLTG